MKRAVGEQIWRTDESPGVPGFKPLPDIPQARCHNNMERKKWFKRSEPRQNFKTTEFLNVCRVFMNIGCFVLSWNPFPHSCASTAVSITMATSLHLQLKFNAPTPRIGRPLFWLIPPPRHSPMYMFHGSEEIVDTLADKWTHLLHKLPSQSIPQLLACFFYTHLDSNCVPLSRLVTPTRRSCMKLLIFSFVRSVALLVLHYCSFFFLLSNMVATPPLF